MATYTKKLKTIIVHLMLDGETVTIEDTASDDMATRALNEFKAYGTMHYETEEGGMAITNAIPYHAVQYIEVTEADASVERPDPYGCDEGGGETITITIRSSHGETIKTVEAKANANVVLNEADFEGGCDFGSGLTSLTITPTEAVVDFKKTDNIITQITVNSSSDIDMKCVCTGYN